MAVRVDPGHVHDAELSRLYEEYSNRLFGYCLYRLGNRTEAEDAVQTTFMYVFRSLQRGVEPENESAWLFTIAHNVCRSTQRSARRRRRVESQQDPQVLQEISPGFERDNDSLLGLEDALSSIPDSQRQAILLREWHGLPYREIATKLGLTQTAVEMLVFRARRSLATALDNGGKQPERRRIASALNIASLVAALRSLIGGSSASGIGVTAAAGIAVVAVGVGGSAPTQTAPVRHVSAKVAPAATSPAIGRGPFATRSTRATRANTPIASGAARDARLPERSDASAADAVAPAESTVTAPSTATTSTPSTPASASDASSRAPAPVSAPVTAPAPVQAVASQLPQLPVIASSAPALPSITLPVPTVSVPTVTVPSVADVAHDVGSSLPKLP